MPVVEVAGPPGPSRFRCVSEHGPPPELRRGVEDWRDYFEQVAASRPGDDLELAFPRGWCRMVDYPWAAAWPTDFDFMTANGADVLPGQLLEREADLAELPSRVRGNVRNVLRPGGQVVRRAAGVGASRATSPRRTRTR